MEDAIRHLDDLVSFIKQVGPDVWAIYMKQAYLYGSVAFTVGLVTIANLMAFLKAKPWDWSHEYEGSMFIWAFATICGTVFGLGFFFDGIFHLVNTEYYVIRELLP